MVTENHWEQFANQFEEDNQYVVGLANIADVKRKLISLSKLGNLLEVGCGNGTYTECFLSSAGLITATDISEEMIKVTQEKFKEQNKVQVAQANCFDLPYADEQFDTVFMANVLHIIPHPEKALAECLRVLKPYGQIIGISFTLHGMRLLEKLKLRYRYHQTYGKRSSHTVKLTPKLADRLLYETGFQSITTQLIGENVKAVYFSGQKIK